MATENLSDGIPLYGVTPAFNENIHFAGSDLNTLRELYPELGNIKDEQFRQGLTGAAGEVLKKNGIVISFPPKE